MSQWTQAEAVELCRAVEAICPAHGCHVALTGGLLYKDGPRKDCDILFYSVRSKGAIDKLALFSALEPILSVTKDFGFCVKATHNGKPVDCFFPEDEKNAQQYSDKRSQQDPDEAEERRRVDQMFAPIEDEIL